jgi:hypothetical protein
MTNKKNPRYRGTANPEMAQAMREIRRSNAAGTHAAGTARQRSRAAARRAAIGREAA